MGEDAAIWKLVVGYLVWLLASAAIALTAGLLVGVVATTFGVEFNSAGHQFMIVIVAGGCFAALAILPFAIRRRLSRSSAEPQA
jgi:hypothetical protein